SLEAPALNSIRMALPQRRLPAAATPQRRIANGPPQPQAKGASVRLRPPTKGHNRFLEIAGLGNESLRHTGERHADLPNPSARGLDWRGLGCRCAVRRFRSDRRDPARVAGWPLASARSAVLTLPGASEIGGRKTEVWRGHSKSQRAQSVSPGSL